MITKRTVHRTDFGERLFTSRERAGLSQNAAAKLIKIAQSTLHGLERSAQGSTYTVRLARLYSVDPMWLETGDGEAAVQIAFDSLSAREAELVTLFRCIRSKERQVDLIARANRFATEGDSRPSRANPYGGLVVPIAAESEPMPYNAEPEPSVPPGKSRR